MAAVTMAPITADVIARKLDNAGRAAGKFDWSIPPGEAASDKETFYVFLEGRRFKVTVEDDGPEGD
jgi:hypothetical protein